MFTTPAPVAHPAAMCHGKVAHRSRANASKHLRRLDEGGHAGRHSLAVYHCPFCDRWHVGHHRSEAQDGGAS